MVHHSRVPAAIEGEELFLVGQKISPAGAPKKVFVNNVEEVIFPLQVTRNGKGTVIKENLPKSPRFKPYSSLDTGDSIDGKNLWGFHSDPIGPDSLRIGDKGRTGAHSGQELRLEGICFLEIIQGWIGDAVSIHPKDILLIKG